MPQTGPKTPAGKAKVAANALKHGLRSHAPVIPGLESPGDWQRHLVGIVARPGAGRPPPAPSTSRSPARIAVKVIQPPWRRGDEGVRVT